MTMMTRSPTLFSGPPAMETQRHQVIEDEGLAELTLNDNGVIRACNKAIERIAKCAAQNLLWQHISVLLPQFADIALVREGEINHRLHYQARIGRCFDLVSADGEHCSVRLCLNECETKGRHYVRVTISEVAENYSH